MNLEESIKEHLEQASKNADIARAAEKLVKCKGRYHAELNYKALAELFGVTVPTVELESKWIKCSDALPEPQQQVLVNDLNGEGVLIAWRALWLGTGGRTTGQWRWVFQVDGIESSDVRINEWCAYPPPTE